MTNAEKCRKYRERHPDRKAAQNADWRERNPYYRQPVSEKTPYWNQKSTARARGIEFNLTFDQWKDWWGEDIDKRGIGEGKLVMARFNDEGAYELGNIKKISSCENTAEYHVRTP